MTETHLTILPTAAPAPVRDRPAAPTTPPDTAVSVSVVLPAFNEAHTIRRTFAAVRQYVQTHREYEFIFVDDGSTDETAAILRQAIRTTGTTRIRLLSLDHNQGKGGAMKRGFEQTRGKLIIFTDGDLAYSLDHLPRLVQAMENNDVVIGSRQLQRRSSDNKRTLARTILGEGFNRLVRLLMGLPYRDTQAGLKGFSRQAAEQIFARTRLRGYSTDVELLFVAHKRGLRIGQIPARVNCEHASKASSMSLLSDPPVMFRDMLRIHLNSLRGRYD